MNPEEIAIAEKKFLEMERIRKVFDSICKKLNLKQGDFFGFYDTRGFAVLNLFDTITNTNRALKVSEGGEILIDTTDYYSINQSHTKKNILFFSAFVEKTDGYSQTKTGILDENFEIILPAIFDSFQELNPKSFRVSNGSFCGVMTTTFEMIIPLTFREIEYNETLNVFKAREVINNGDHAVYHLFDQTGRFLKKLEYGLVTFENDPSYYTIYDTKVRSDVYYDHTDMIGNRGLLDRNFNMIIPPVYDMIFQGRTSIIVYDRKNAAPNFDHDFVNSPSLDSFFVLDGGKCAVFDYNQNLQIPFVYNWIEPTFDSTLFLINPTGLLYYSRYIQDDKGHWGVQGGKWGLISNSNKIIVAPVYNFVAHYDAKVIFYNQQSDNGTILDIENAITILLNPENRNS